MRARTRRPRNMAADAAPAWQAALCRELDAATFRPHHATDKRFALDRVRDSPAIHWVAAPAPRDVAAFAARMRKHFELFVVHECSPRVVEWIWAAFGTMCTNYGHSPAINASVIVTPVVLVDLTGAPDAVRRAEALYTSLLALTCRYEREGDGWVSVQAQVIVVGDRPPVVGHVHSDAMATYLVGADGDLVPDKAYDTMNRIFDDERRLMRERDA